MKKILVVAILFLACTPPKPYRITNFFINSEAVSDIRQQRIAVLEFENQTRTFEAGIGLADEFSIQLGKLGKFELVERQKVEELFKEQDIDPKRLDPATAVKIGKMLGAHGVILGTVRAYQPDKVGLSVRLVSVETGRQVWEAGDTVYGDDGRIGVLVDRSDRYRLTRDKDFLAQVLCKLLVETLVSAMR
jgi:TolB-like protein